MSRWGRDRSRSGDDLDTRVRSAAFAFLATVRRTHPAAVPHRVLRDGFAFADTRVPLWGPQGIFKPAILPEMPLTFRTAPVVEGRPRPYEDRLGTDGLIHYRYRGEDPGHRDNAGMRLAMERGVPLIYLFGLVPGLYAAEGPAYVVGDDPARLVFAVALDEATSLDRPPGPPGVGEPMAAARRIYFTSTVQRRLHQEGFRERVLRAYRECCAICRLGHRELLDAAHILRDTHPKGEPWVSNGLSLCKLHHAAFDRNFLGVRPDLVVEVRKDVLLEDDGPMLVHGLQDCHGKSLVVVPGVANLKPRHDFLEERYEEFRRAV